ncbi:MAG TPA: XrtA system polysaccharide chain length determinant [Sphingomonas sp.]|nr:XrtA system polysaccharide chain length determinant [Sphingomonas sp.]
MNGLYDELRLALHSVWQRRWIALAAAWAICLVGWFAVAQIPNSYESHARVFVQMNSILPGKLGITPGDQQKDVDRIRQTLASSVNLQKVVRGTDLAATVSTDKDVAARAAGLKDAVKITAQQDNLFEITATAASPKLAHDIVQKLIDIFVEENLAGDRSETTESLGFLDAQLAARQHRLQEADQKRADFNAQYLGSLPGTGSLEDRIAAARSQLAQVDSDLAAAQSSLSAVNAQMAGTPATVAGPGGTTLGPAHARVAAILGQLADARARGFTDSHPDVIALQSQLKIAQAAAAREPAGASSGTPNPLYMSLQSMQAEKSSTVASLLSRKQQIAGDLATLQTRLAADPGVAAQQAQLERDYQVLKDQYDKLLADREDVKLRSQAQTQTDAIKFNVVDPPTSPTAPTAPNRVLLLTGVLIVGLIGGVAGAFGLGQLKTTFASAPRLEAATGLPVIGSVSMMLGEAERALRFRRLKLFAGGAAALGVAYVALLGVEFLQRGLAA